MDSQTARIRLRLALSYLEKAQGEGGRPRAHVHRAEAWVANVRRQIRRRAAPAASRLRAVLREQAQLSLRVVGGRINAQQANVLNRRLLDEINRLRIEAAEWNTLVTAQRAEEIGGLIDWPLARYARKARWTVAGIDLKPTRVGFVLWLIVFVAALAGSLVYLGMVPTRTTVALDISAPDVRTGAIHIMLENKTQFPFTVWVPGPEDSTALETPESAAAYGLLIRGREKNASEFRVVSVPPAAWSYEGVWLREPALLTLQPDLPLDLAFDPARLNAASSFESLRLSLSRLRDGVTLVEKPLR